MLSSMVKEHQIRQQLRREEQERRRKEALQASTSLTNALVDHLNVGVAQAYLNQKRLDGEARRLEQSAAVLQKQTQHWITLVHGFCSALKQVGDVASWTIAIHRDVATVAATLQIAYADTYARTHPSTAQGASTLGPLGLPPAPSALVTRAGTATVIPSTADNTGSVTASSSVSSSSSPKSSATIRVKKSASAGGGGATVTIVSALDTFEEGSVSGRDNGAVTSSGSNSKDDTSVPESESEDIDESRDQSTQIKTK